MRAFDPQEPLIFIHVPKSAGGAVRRVVEGWFPDRFHRHYAVESTGTPPEVLPLTAPCHQQVPPVIYGHFNMLRGFGIKDHYPSVSQFVTILRDPFETMISNYFFVRKVSGAWKDQSRVPKGDLEAHIKTGHVNILNHFPRQMTLHNYKDIFEECFIEVGVTEHLPESLERIAGKLDKTFDRGTLERVNVTKRDQPVPESYRVLFREKHPLEYAVYEFAKSRFSTA